MAVHKESQCLAPIDEPTAPRRGQIAHYGTMARADSVISNFEIPDDSDYQSSSGDTTEASIEGADTSCESSDDQEVPDTPVRPSPDVFDNPPLTPMAVQQSRGLVRQQALSSVTAWSPIKNIESLMVNVMEDEEEDEVGDRSGLVSESFLGQARSEGGRQEGMEEEAVSGDTLEDMVKAYSAEATSTPRHKEQIPFEHNGADMASATKANINHTPTPALPSTNSLVPAPELSKSTISRDVFAPRRSSQIPRPTFGSSTSALKPTAAHNRMSGISNFGNLVRRSGLIFSAGPGSRAYSTVGDRTTTTPANSARRSMLPGNFQTPKTPSAVSRLSYATTSKRMSFGPSRIASSLGKSTSGTGESTSGTLDAQTPCLKRSFAHGSTKISDYPADTARAARMRREAQVILDGKISEALIARSVPKWGIPV